MPPGAPAPRPAAAHAELGKSAPVPEVSELQTTSTLSPTDAGVGESSTPSAGMPTPAEPVAHEPQRMLEVEAWLSIETRDLAVTAERLRQLLSSHRATITRDLLVREGERQRVELTFRVPANTTDAVLPKVEALGVVREKNVSAREVSKEYFDTELRLRNLEVTLARYQELLARAQTVEEMLSIEQELTRLRGEIEQLKGTLRYLRDRVAQATVHVTLWAAEQSSGEVVHPEAGLFPGVRVGYAFDPGHRLASTGYLTTGISVRFVERFSLDADALRSSSPWESEVDGFWVSLGADRYSEFFGNGRRRWFNPYLGFRVGYGHRAHGSEMLAGVTTGLELFKTEYVVWELDVRTLGLLFNPEAGTRIAVQPTLGFHVAF